ncbi:beta-1,6-N-acetylglucosaminyltransferase [Clostridium tagluense]|uniref:beta-1,6-N-acetylglucosaminyltransferase n=1 Tax=Clostridium tagluense TaxID=360422 RepID=UPI001CF5FD69|nr:beta-1,6-N-acetylglucosaminyltransferase [Clostridium tagluense]MCB2312378.1 beta-1,6-N-acetylglucosaminyltransferase [Clostridium tagluense]MCB2317053.1 beta-1,6-N-acetylglucosaminyltransferase [Clostridium tagluense]MCB2321920.1 beta-1,6-N-acetylglucosaminyltransferase [Clostridium tagluense]MCB2326835.1 beta-1,6-N-acetylglucosaminyltransferase [Clostridium tagluense]MCB2331647.1 beta-1,6-N-acetylglucosaminyltransferase [Clostridium tagluense]
MKIAYLILTHKSSIQLTRLINTLNCEEVYFFIHVDKNSSDEFFYEVNNTFKTYKNVFFIDRSSCAWGEFGIVEATIEGIKRIIVSNINIDYVVLLSGQDYPIKSNKYIKEFFTTNNGKCFIHNFPIPRPGFHNGFYNRIPPKYKLPWNISLWGGSQWWCLTRECIYYIYYFIMKNPAYIEYCKHLVVPDEIFFQTIVMNLNFKSNIVNDGLKYIDFDSAPPPKNHPVTLSKEHFSTLSNSTSLFARKFDIEYDYEILDMIDKDILKI